ncbi:MAG: LamG-like jellyroll fold domain-containing protein, partial [Planctomycetota bacterium]
MRRVKGSQISLVLLGVVFAGFALLLPTRTIRASGLISLWRFDEGEGTIAHDSVGGNHGTVYDANWTTGIIEGALSFDGVGDYVDVGNDNSLKPPLPVTLSTWINLSSSDSTQYIIALDHQTPLYYGIWWYVRSAGNLAINYGDGGIPDYTSRRSKAGTTVLDADTWYHVAAVIRGPTDMSLYVDGIDDGGTYSGSGWSLAYSSASSLMGMRDDSAHCLDAIIDDARVYEEALSAEEISELYEMCLGGHTGISVWSEHLEFDANEGGSNPASQTISIRNTGVGILDYRITEDCPWLEVDPNSGTSVGETDDVTVSADISGLA